MLAGKVKGGRLSATEELTTVIASYLVCSEVAKVEMAAPVRV
jgi:hypothetical protein